MEDRGTWGNKLAASPMPKAPTMAKDRAAFRRDPEWVLRVDPRTATELFPWAVQFRREARQLLGSADQLF